jgi:UDP-N-acetylglucosamine--N-acetylmuramyl-(pentapeptide) pyrophosphoryl-undecaprenol N-acetylglucosamine transferase
LAVVEQLKVGRVQVEGKSEPVTFEPSNLELLWVGGEGGMEKELVERQGIPFQAIPAAGVHGVGLRRLPGNVSAILRGITASRRLLNEFKPDVLFFTGGYVAFPMALAGRRIPTLLYVPDIEPGLALKTIARFADTITVTAERSRPFFKSHAQVVVTGYPVRRDIAQWDKDIARQSLDLEDDLPALLVFGGSKGARSINLALLDSLPGLLGEMQILHISGNLDWPTVEAAKAKLPEDLARRYHAYPYLHEEMGAALAAADLVVARAGASTLGEFPLLGLPAVLVPYPYAWRYQKVNADYLAGQGAALVLDDASLKSDLAATVKRLMLDTPRLDAMRKAMRSLSRPQAAAGIAGQLASLAGKS